VTGQKIDWKRVTVRLSVKKGAMGRAALLNTRSKAKTLHIPDHHPALVLSPAFSGEEGCAARGFAVVDKQHADGQEGTMP
jgi:hypothetical protein